VLLASAATAAPSARGAFELDSAGYCGDLEQRVVESDRVWMTCTCGAVIKRSADDDCPRLLVRVAALVHVAPFG
jgi:hypothetical protein